MPVGGDAVEEVVNGEVRIMPPNKWKLPESRSFEVLHLEEGKLRTVRVLSSGRLSPRRFPSVDVEGSSIWPD